MKELVIVLRWFIGFLTFLLGLMTLILFLKYIWDLVIIRNIILIVLSFGLFGMSLDIKEDDRKLTLLLLISTISMVGFTSWTLFKQILN
ncbi:hypothetical protein DLI72_20225 [Acinetobacter baumannii]|nr:hypothetical protein DLI72_20225 [Acinetobacter baumannii]